MNKRAISVTIVGAALALGLGTTIAGAAPGDSSDGKIYWCYNKQDSSKNYVQFRTPQPKNCSPGYQRFSFNAQGVPGQDGQDGENGADAMISRTAVSQLNNRADSGVGGDWAVDQISRSYTVTRQHAAEAAKCGNTATQCWFYTAALMDSGSFETTPGANAPNSGNPINGTVQGTLNGTEQIEFYASSDNPNPNLLQDSYTGNGQSTSSWYKQFFPGNTTFGGVGETYFSWTYTSNCESWTNASTGNDGDITGNGTCG